MLELLIALLLAGLTSGGGSPGAAASSASSPRATTVWAVGDADARTPAARRLARRIRTAHPDLFLYLGDVYPAGSAADFKRTYDPLYGRLARRTRPTPGNHDWPLHGVGYLPYWRARLGGTPRRYYSFRAGGWRVLSLNSELAGAAMRRQVRWLRRQLRPGGDCRLAYWHRPRFSAGPHGDSTQVAPLWRVLRGHARLVLSGHDHDLQVLRPEGGLTQFVVGAGGHGHYPLDRSYRRLAWGSDRVYGALRLTLSPGGARYEFVSAGGRVLRRGAAHCSPG